MMENVANSWTRQQAIDLLQSSLEHHPAPMAAINRQGSVVMHNDAFRHMLGYSLQELSNRNIRSLQECDMEAEELLALELISHVRDRYEFDKLLLHKDGRRIAVHQTATLANCDDVLLLVSYAMSAEREQRSGRLRTRERFFRRLMENNDRVFFYELDEEERFAYLSPAVRKVLGARTEELIGRRWTEVLNAVEETEEIEPGAESRATTQWMATASTRMGDPLQLEVLHMRRTAPDGRAYWLGAARDVTRARHIESRQLLMREILHAIDSLVLVADESGSVIYASPAVAQIVKCRLRHILGVGWWRMSQADEVSAAAAQEQAASLARGDTQARAKFWEQELHDREGARHWIQWRERSGGGLAIFSGTDVTTCKWAEVALRARTEQLAGLIDNCPIGIVIVGRENQIQNCNRAFEQIFWTSESEVRGKRFSDILSDVGCSDELEGMQKRLSLGEIGSAHVRFERRDGAIIDVEMQAVPLRSGGRTVGYYMLLNDVTERLRSEHALQQSERQLRAIFDHSLDGMFLVGRNGCYVDVNPSGCKLLGRSREEIVERPVGSFCVPQSRDLILSELINDDANLRQLSIVRPNSEQRQVEFTFTKDILHGLSLLVTHDRTEFVELESRLLQSQKMEAIGRLAGGVAHDINNMLTVIRGYSELMVKKLPAGHAMLRYAHSIVSAADRSSMVTQQLLAFSRRQVIVPQVVGANRVISEILKLIQRLIGEDIELSVTLDNEAGLIKVDPSQIGQVLMNLAVNARDAMPQGGWLHITTSRVDQVTPPEQDPPRPAGPYVRIDVSDNGCGMSDEVMNHIFEPFFTTKETGKGTGLGLSTVYGIVKQCGGWVSVESQIGSGSTFRVYLPRLEETITEDSVERLAGLNGHEDHLGPQGHDVKVV